MSAIKTNSEKNKMMIERVAIDDTEMSSRSVSVLGLTDRVGVRFSKWLGVPTMKNAAIGCLAMALAFTASASHLSAQEDQAEMGLSAGILLAPKAFRAATKKVLPCLVTIESFGGVGSVQGKIGGIRRQGEGSTTGIIVSADGYVITSSFNFIQKPRVITLKTFDGTAYLAKPIANDNTRKLTLLKIQNESKSGEAKPLNLNVAEFVADDQIRVGQWAVTMGIGFGDSNPAISIGIISAKNRGFGRAVQTDANVSPANYGGPMVDIQGRIIGVCVPLNPKSTSLASGVEWYDSGIGFAIPLHDPTIIEKLKKGKDINRAFIGVQPKPAKLDGSGVKIVSVVASSPAAKAGLKKDDEVVKLGEYVVQDVNQFGTLVGRFDSDSKTTITYLRSGKSTTSDIAFSSPPKTAPKTAAKDTSRPKFALPKKSAEGSKGKGESKDEEKKDGDIRRAASKENASKGD